MKFKTKKTSSFRAAGRALSAFVLIALPIISITGTIPRLPNTRQELLQITFSPQLTPINFTVTPEATNLGSLEFLDSTTEESEAGEDDDELSISGGDWFVGYDLVQTPNGPQWHLWVNGELIIVEPNDAATTSLINAFMIQADNRARALSDIESADSTRDIAYAGAGAGAVSLVGGTVTAVLGCAGVPFTFWAAGGTGWACAGGIAAGIGGLGALAGSAVQIFQSGKDISDAEARYDTAHQAAEELFDAIHQGSESP